MNICRRRRGASTMRSRRDVLSRERAGADRRDDLSDCLVFPRALVSPATYDDGALERPVLAEGIKLPTDDRQVARHTPRQVTLDDPGELPGSPRVAEKLSKSVRKVALRVENRPKFYRPALAVLGRLWRNVAQTAAKFDQICSTWAKVW